jgi:hypothetical protein
MILSGIALLLQLVVPPRQSRPVLSFPEPGLDDTAAYQGYQTRFYRDAAGNTVQIYLDGRSGRVVHLLADADNESVGFTARDSHGAAAKLQWTEPEANAAGVGRLRTLEHRLVANAPHVYIGWFLLGSMRVERDLQYAGRHRAPFSAAPYIPAEFERLLTALGQLDPAERRRHLALLAAPDIETLHARLAPSITTRKSASSWVARVIQPSLDRRDTLALELLVDPRQVTAMRTGDSISLQARPGGSQQIRFVVRIATTARALTPLARNEIFTGDFLRFLDASKSASQSDSDVLRARWLERQVRGVELLSSREKLMAGLPAYATYFGRDMMVSALMMRPIWRDDMSAFVVASVLRKLSPAGEVSHEEALGGQADREAAAEYATLVGAYLKAKQGGARADADRLLDSARTVLRDHRRVRENYHMIDDEFQLPVLAARWLGDPNVPATRKRAFLLDSSDGGGSRLERLLRELALVERMTAAYVANPVAANLVSFPPRDNGQWSSASWRDSGDGYAGGRYAMDVNAIWAPQALEGIASIYETLRAIGLRTDTSDSQRLRKATEAWKGAWRHFVVRLAPAEVQSRVAARIAAFPDEERRYWTNLIASTRADQDSLEFLALSLDAEGRPIGVANTDPATRLFLGASGDTAGVVRDVRLFVRPYPAGLFIDRVGPVVANDAYAPPAIWPQFERDRYHGPRVVWGREVNLFLLGVANHLQGASDPTYAAELRAAMARVHSAVVASGFHSELWSYELRGGRVEPTRYGTGSDVQLWSTTDLAVQFALSRLRPQ